MRLRRVVGVSFLGVIGPSTEYSMVFLYFVFAFCNSFPLKLHFIHEFAEYKVRFYQDPCFSFQLHRHTARSSPPGETCSTPSSRSEHRWTRALHHQKWLGPRDRWHKCLTSSNKDATRNKCLATSNKKLLVTSARIESRWHKGPQGRWFRWIPNPHLSKTSAGVPVPSNL